MQHQQGTSSVKQAELIDITDLHNPVLNGFQRGAIAASAAYPVVLSVDAVLGAARATTGLDDFGSLDFIPRLKVWLQAVDEDSGASPVTRSNLFIMTVRYAATRLRLEDLIRRHPEILDIVIN